MRQNNVDGSSSRRGRSSKAIGELQENRSVFAHVLSNVETSVDLLGVAEEELVHSMVRFWEEVETSAARLDIIEVGCRRDRETAGPTARTIPAHR